MRRTMLLLSGVTLAFSVGRPLVAQTFRVPRGARVRVVTTDSKKPVIGVADSVTETMISVAVHRDTTWIPIRTISQVDVSKGHMRPTWSKTAPLWLTAAAGAVGAGLAYAEAPKDDILGRGGEAAVGGALGATLGLIAGTIIALEVVQETWEPVMGGVSPRSSAAPSLYVAPRGTGVAFGLHATF